MFHKTDTDHSKRRNVVPSYADKKNGILATDIEYEVDVYGNSCEMITPIEFQSQTKLTTDSDDLDKLIARNISTQLDTESYFQRFYELKKQYVNHNCSMNKVGESDKVNTDDNDKNDVITYPSDMIKSSKTQRTLSPRSKFLTSCILNSVDHPPHKLFVKGFSSSSLTVFNISNQHIGDKIGILLANSLKLMPQIEYINISKNNLSHRSIDLILKSLTSSTLESNTPNIYGLDLSYNHVQLETIFTLKTFICTYKDLNNLVLRSLELNDFQLSIILKALKYHNTIASLDISENCLTGKSTVKLNPQQLQLAIKYDDIASYGKVNEASSILCLGSYLGFSSGKSDVKSSFCPLKTLTIGWNRYRDKQTCYLLSKSLTFYNSNLVTLDISNNSCLDGENGINFACIFEKTLTLKSMNISSNELTDEACYMIIANIRCRLRYKLPLNSDTKSNSPSLFTLNISNNPIREKSFNAIVCLLLDESILPKVNKRIEIIMEYITFLVADISTCWLVSSPYDSYMEKGITAIKYEGSGSTADIDLNKDNSRVVDEVTPTEAVVENSSITTRRFVYDINSPYHRTRCLELLHDLAYINDDEIVDTNSMYYGMESPINQTGRHVDCLSLKITGGNSVMPYDELNYSKGDSNMHPGSVNAKSESIELILKNADMNNDLTLSILKDFEIQEIESKCHEYLDKYKLMRVKQPVKTPIKSKVSTPKSRMKSRGSDLSFLMDFNKKNSDRKTATPTISEVNEKSELFSSDAIEARVETAIPTVRYLSHEEIVYLFKKISKDYFADNECILKVFKLFEVLECNKIEVSKFFEILVSLLKRIKKSRRIGKSKGYKYFALSETKPKSSSSEGLIDFYELPRSGEIEFNLQI